MNIEIGSGDRPTPGFLSSDINTSKNVDFVGNPWELDLNDACVNRFLALGVMEHLTYLQFSKTLSFVYNKLKDGGDFYFDVPDLPKWCEYYLKAIRDEKVPFTLEHIHSTLYGWQRWSGDEHKSGWSYKTLNSELKLNPWKKIEYGVDMFIKEGYIRRRMSREGDAHIYVRVVK